MRRFTFPAPAVILSGFTAMGSLWLSGCALPERTAAESAGPAAGRWIDARANVFTASTQERTAVAFDEIGNVVVAWDSKRQQDGQHGVYGRVLNAAGDPLTSEIELNDFRNSSQSHPAVASGAGGTWIAWTSVGQDSVGAAVVARRFDARLRALSPEIIMNDPARGHQGDPALAMNARGEAMVVWTSVEDIARGMRVQARMIGADGMPRGAILEIEAPEGAADSLPVVAAAGDGFVLAWSRRADAKADSSSVLVQRVDSEGRTIGEAIEVSAGRAGENIEPSVAGEPGGGFSVAWHCAEAGAGDHRVVLRRFGHDDSPAHEMLFVSDLGAGWVSGAAVALANDGRAFVTWNQWNVDGDGLGIAARWIDANGRAHSEPFVVTAARKGHQSLAIASNAPRMAIRDAGQIAIAWSGDSGFDDDSAANVSVYLPATVVAEETQRAIALAESAPPPIAPIPPVFDPNWKPLPPPEDPGDGASGSFMGINFTGWTPPDPEIAVGPDHLVAITNGAIAFFDMNGTNLFQDEIEGSQGFWGAQGATGFVFDPETLYDPHSGRFFAMACERASNGLSYYLLAVSDDSNPVGTWHKYRIHTPVDNDIDSPNMAVDDTVVYLSADFFGPDKYGVLMIEKAPILSGGAINSRAFTITGSSEQSMGMPIIYDAAAPAGYLIQSAENGTPNGITFSEVRFHGIRNQLTTPTRVTIDIAVPTYSYPNQPPQQGTTNRPFLFEPRFWSCMYVGGSMWAIHHVNSSRARARWYEFEMNGWPESGQNPTLRQWGELDYGDPVHTFFPSIAADASGNAVFVFARSSPSEFISMCGTFRLASDPLGTTRPMSFIKQSTVPYTGAARWGDYSHIEPDPDTDFTQFWGMHEWTDTSNAWRTWIARIDTIPEIATLTDLSIPFGTLIAGGLPELLDSDNARVRVRSELGFSAIEPNLVELRIGATTGNLAAATLSLSVEGRLNQVGGMARLRLRNWATNTFQQVHQYPIGSTESIETINGIDATDRIRQTDGRILLSIRNSAVATFSAAGFDSFTDHVVISPQ